MTALRLALSDLEEPVVRADHEAGSDRCAVGAGRGVGDVTLQPVQVPDLRVELAVDALDRAVEGDEPVALDRGEADDGLGCLRDPPVDPAGSFVAGRPCNWSRLPGRADWSRFGWPGLGEDAPVADLFAMAGDIGDPRAENEREPGGLDRLPVRLGDHARVRDYGDVRELVGGHELLRNRQHGLRFRPVALERGDQQREAVLPGQQPDRDLRPRGVDPRISCRTSPDQAGWP